MNKINEILEYGLLSEFGYLKLEDEYFKENNQFVGNYKGKYSVYKLKGESEVNELFSRYSALLNIKSDLKVDSSKSAIREYTTQYGQSDLSFIIACEEEKLPVNTIFCQNSSLPHKNTFTLTYVSLKNILTRSLAFEENLAFTDSFYNRKVT